MLTKLASRYRTYLIRRPAGITDQEYRIHILGRGMYPFGLLGHVAFLAVFWWIEAWPLVWFNIASIVIFAAASWVASVKNRFAPWTFVATNIFEVPAHGVLATVWLGLETGFNIYIMSTVVLVMIVPFISRTLRSVLALFYLAIFALSGAYVLWIGPIHPLPDVLNIAFFTANAAFLCMIMATCMGLYEWAASIAEKGLLDSRKRTEIANRSLENVSAQLAKYISPQLYGAILNGEQEVKVESKRKKLTVFFSDIVGFTETTDQLQSEELTALLNEYLTEMSKIAQSYGANFDKFIGDAIVLYFGDPETLGTKEDAAQCVRMAIAMQRRMQELRKRWLEMGLERPFEMRIGINTGFCTVGNFGSEDRMDYTIIGGEVNLAARLESLADKGGILLSHETWSLVKDWAMAEPAETVTVKGIANPVKTHRVLGLYDDLAAEGRIIHHDDEGLTLTVDRERLDDGHREKAIEVLQTTLDELKSEK